MKKGFSLLRLTMTYNTFAYDTLKLDSFTLKCRRVLLSTISLLTVGETVFIA